jgi:hypothetical protein
MKDFIPPNEALELKHLGFDESIPTFYSYPENKLSYTMDGHNQVSVRRNSQFGHAVSAPTFSQAFSWFRKKYTMDIHIRGTYFRASWVIGIAKENILQAKDGYPLVTNWEYIIPDGVDVLTYEEAELACLKKLIELAKK